MKLMILDGNSVMNRAFFGVKPLTTKDGLFTNAVYGFLNILERMDREEQPDAICVAFDLHAPTFRHKRYEGYKANRHGMPEELRQQFPLIKDILRAMQIPIYECEGWEADDVIGTVGRICADQQWNCVIVTGDRDSLQLIDPYVHVKLVISKMGQTESTVYDTEAFEKEYGFAPKKMIDLKALMGDSSDNIPGVAGIGPKTAKDLLYKFGSLDGVYQNLTDASIRPKLREKLEQGKDSAYLSYELATIIPEAPIVFYPEDAKKTEWDCAKLYGIFQKLEFIKLIDRYSLRSSANVPVQASVVAAPLPRVEALPESLEACALYISADGTIGIAWADGVTTLTPMELAGRQDLIPSLGKLTMHDSKQQRHQMAGFADCRNAEFDTALAAYDLNPSQSDYPVSRLSVAYLGRTVDDGDAAGCAEAVWQLRSILEKELKEKELWNLYTTIELPLCEVLYRMEERGIAIDKAQLEQFGAMLSQRISDCEAVIYSYAGRSFNILSPKQLGELLFEELGIPAGKKTKTGYSTSAEVLEKLKFVHPIIPAILDYRMLTKLKSTYADGLLKVIREDGRIHTTFQNLVTATGRLSSTEPNLQNIPVRTDLGAEIRKMFIPRSGYVLVDADYSQIELRVLAHIAEDRNMTEAFCSGMDIHTATASQVFHVPPEAVTPLQRRHAKAVNFGIVYGISEFSLSDDIGVSRYAARQYIDDYLNNYSGVRSYMSSVVNDARQKGFTKTLYGRRRYIPELTSANHNVRQSAERIALNTPIQGTAADIIKLAMIQVEKALNEKYPQASLLLQVHDELIIECPEEIAQQVAELVSEQMQNAAALRVPLIAEAKTGRNWYEAK